jgi:hypothetical protein
MLGRYAPFLSGATREYIVDESLNACFVVTRSSTSGW